MFEESI